MILLTFSVVNYPSTSSAQISNLSLESIDSESAEASEGETANLSLESADMSYDPST